MVFSGSRGAFGFGRCKTRAETQTGQRPLGKTSRAYGLGPVRKKGPGVDSRVETNIAM